MTDLGAAIAGGMGLAAGANLNPERKYPSMFEPIHGSAPDIAGKGIANQIAVDKQLKCSVINENGLIFSSADYRTPTILSWILQRFCKEQIK